MVSDSDLKILKSYNVSLERKLEILPEEIKNLIISDYIEHKLTVKTLYQKYKHVVTYPIITKILKDSSNLRNQRILYNSEFFKIMSPELAYFGGLLYADGNIYKRDDCIGHTVQLAVSVKDIEIIEKFCFYAEIDFKRVGFVTNTARENQDFIKSGTISKLVYIRLTGEDLAESLLPFSIIPRKTYNYVEPNIPKHLIPNYIKGMIDGDGWISISRRKNYFVYQIGVCGGPEMMSWVFDRFKEFGFSNNLFYSEKITKPYNYTLARVSLHGLDNMLKLSEILNFREQPRLERKWSKIDALEQLVKERKEYFAERKLTFDERNREYKKQYGIKNKEKIKQRLKKYFSDMSPEDFLSWKENRSLTVKKHKEKLKSLGVKSIKELNKPD